MLLLQHIIPSEGLPRIFSIAEPQSVKLNVTRYGEKKFVIQHFVLLLRVVRGEMRYSSQYGKIFTDGHCSKTEIISLFHSFMYILLTKWLKDHYIAGKSQLPTILLFVQASNYIFNEVCRGCGNYNSVQNIIEYELLLKLTEFAKCLYS